MLETQLFLLIDVSRPVNVRKARLSAPAQYHIFTHSLSPQLVDNLWALHMLNENYV
jgi:hypothetical protein